MKRLLPLFCLLGLLQLPAFAQNKELIVSGRVIQEGHRCEFASINVYSGNELYRSFETNKQGRYGLNLPFGHYFTLEFSKDGFKTKRIAFDTRDVKSKGAVEPFECDVELYAYERFKDLDTSTLDFPMAIVIYRGKGRFDYDEKYYKMMQKAYEQLMAQAAERNPTTNTANLNDR